MNKILVVIDMQEDFIYGDYGTVEAIQACKNVEEKIKQLPKNSFVFFTQDTHYDHYLNPTANELHKMDGWHIPFDIMFAMAFNENIVDVFVQTKSTFGSEELLDEIEKVCISQELREYIEIEIVGLTTDMCVITNALLIKTRFPEIPISVDAKCCAGSTPELHECALRIMENCHIKIK